jgi:hypothetical protein
LQSKPNTRRFQFQLPGLKYTLTITGENYLVGPNTELYPSGEIGFKVAPAVFVRVIDYTEPIETWAYETTKVRFAITAGDMYSWAESFSLQGFPSVISYLQADETPITTRLHKYADTWVTDLAQIAEIQNRLTSGPSEPEYESSTADANTDPGEPSPLPPVDERDLPLEMYVDYDEIKEEDQNKENP